MKKLLAISRFAPAEPDARTARQWRDAWNEQHPTKEPQKTAPKNIYDAAENGGGFPKSDSARNAPNFGGAFILAGKFLIESRKLSERDDAYERYKTDEWPLVWAKRVMDLAEAFDSKTES